VKSVFVALVVAVLTFPLLFSAAMDKGLTHDEHQHIAAGALLARDGLLPYRDFPHFHTPHLVFVYAGLFQLSDHLLIAARTFSEICSALIAGTIFAVAWAAFRDWRWWARLAGSVGALALLVSAPVFLKSAGSAWNQQPSVLFAVLSTLLVLFAAQTKRAGLMLFTAGICLGLSVGFRLTFAPIALPLLGIIYFNPQLPAQPRLRLIGWMSAGAVLGLLPLWWLLIIAPEQTLFGNFGFPKVNITYRFATGEPRTMTLATKLRFVVKEVARPNWPVLVALAVSVGWYVRFSLRKSERFSLIALAILFPFVLAGSMAPSPLYEQYFYAPLPFVILAIVWAARSLGHGGTAARIAAATLAATVVVSIALVANEYIDDLKNLHRPDKWKTVRLRRDALKLRDRIGSGPVLTLGPIEALEAGLDIYRPLSTGPFAFRVARFIEPHNRQRLGMIAPDDLDQYLRTQPPPAAILLEQAAKEWWFREYTLSAKRRLWLPAREQP